MYFQEKSSILNPYKILNQQLQGVKILINSDDHFVALNDKGQVLTMGQNTLGQCGLLDNSKTTSPPYI